MKRPALQFSHANGFPAPCYASMLAPLGHGYRVHAIEAIGTDPRYPVTDGWPNLVRQLIDEIEHRWHGEPVFGVGHSLGAYLTFLAAAARPELFRGIVLLDAPVIGPVKGRLLGATKRIGIVDRVTPAGATRDRRRVWASREAAARHFRSRPLYRDFSEVGFADYLQHGLVGVPGEYRLRFDPEVEYAIYRTLPHDMSRHLARLRVPAGFIGGETSDVLRRVGMGTMRGARFIKQRVPGGHLFPFEHPAVTARAIDAQITELARRAGSIAGWAR